MERDTNIYCLKLDPVTGSYVSLALLRNVKNGKVVKEKVMSGALQCALLKPALIIDPFQVVVAANKAAVSQVSGTMVTKSVYTEMLFGLSVSKNISQSLMKFGFHEDDEDTLVATLDNENGTRIHEVISEIDGQLVSMDQLSSLSDKKLLCKSYKLSETELKVTSLVDLVVSRIATNHFVSY